MNSRDNFSPKVINTIKLQSALICSNPDCRKLTVAPSLTDETKVQYIGKAAHISAAAINGPRYIVTMLPKERKAVANAIFLCSNCADLIDKNNGVDYSISKLNSWKIEHFAWVKANLNKGQDAPANSVISNGQSGGYTASTINITNSHPVVDQKIELDKTVFKAGDQIFNDQIMHRLYEGLNDYAECYMNDKECLYKISLFYRKPANSYLNANVEGAMKKFIMRAEFLNAFTNSNNFDQWPYNQAGSNFKIMLRPEFLRDTPYRKSKPDDKMKWDKLFAELQKKICALQKSYAKFRKIVKVELYI